MKFKISVSKKERCCRRCMGIINIGQEHWSRRTTHTVQQLNEETGYLQTWSEPYRENYHIKGQCIDFRVKA